MTCNATSPFMMRLSVFGQWVSLKGVGLDKGACWSYAQGMLNRSRKPRPSDLNQLAKSIVQDTTEDSLPEKNPAAVALGHLGGLKGGPARAAKLSAKKRKAIAQKAAKARWERKAESA